MAEGVQLRLISERHDGNPEVTFKERHDGDAEVTFKGRHDGDPEVMFKGRAEGNQEVSSKEQDYRKTDENYSMDDIAPGPDVELPDQDIIEEYDHNLPPDGGWGWFVVLGSFIAHIVIGGLERCKGVIVLELLGRFQESASATSWVASLSTGIRLILGPVACALCNRFSVRKVVFVGGFLITGGCLLCAFASSLISIHLSFGVLGGIGRAFCYTPSVVIVGMYFDRRRGMAVGLATAGVGVGTFVLPSLTEYLFKTYGFTGAFILLGGYVFHVLISAMLYRPLDLNWKLTSKKRLSLKKTTSIEFLEQQQKNEHDAVLEKADPVLGAATDKEQTCYPGELHDVYAHRSIAQERIILLENKPEDLEESTKRLTEQKSINNEKSTIKDASKKMMTEGASNEMATNKGSTLDIKLLKDPLFLSFCFTMGLFTLAFEISLVFLPALGESKGLSKTEAALMLSVMGVTDTIARFASGVIFDLRPVLPYRRYVYNVVLLLIAAVTLMYPLLTSLPGFIAFSLIFGILSGTYIAQMSVIIVDLVGKDRLVSAFGISVWFQGMGSFIGPPIAGELRDSLGNYDATFYFGGAATFIAGAIFTMSTIYYYCKQRRSTKTKATLVR